MFNYAFAAACSGGLALLDRRANSSRASRVCDWAESTNIACVANPVKLRKAQFGKGWCGRRLVLSLPIMTDFIIDYTFLKLYIQT